MAWVEQTAPASCPLALRLLFKFTIALFGQERDREASVMRKVFVVLLLLVVAGVGLGFYRGWFGFSTSRDPETGKTEAQLSIDQDKMKADVKKTKEKVGGVASQAKEKVTGAVSQTKDQPEGKAKDQPEGK
jgi:hypothetical protein